jgi:hypothetical protein
MVQPKQMYANREKSAGIQLKGIVTKQTKTRQEILVYLKQSSSSCPYGLCNVIPAWYLATLPLHASTSIMVSSATCLRQFYVEQHGLSTPI